MRIAVASQGTSLDAWVGVDMASCSQFLVVDSESWDLVIVAIPEEQATPERLSPALIRALVGQGVSVVVGGALAAPCSQALEALGIEAVSGAARTTVRDAVARYAQSGAEGLLSVATPPELIAVSSEGPGLEAPLHTQGQPCSAFVLVNAQSLACSLVEVTPGASLEETSVNAVRAAARAGATVVITPSIRPACCSALRALGVRVAMAEGQMTVGEAVRRFRRGELAPAPY